MDFRRFEINLPIGGKIIAGREQVTDERRLRRLSLCKMVIGKGDAERLQDIQNPIHF